MSQEISPSVQSKILVPLILITFVGLLLAIFTSKSSDNRTHNVTHNNTTHLKPKQNDAWILFPISVSLLIIALLIICIWGKICNCSSLQSLQRTIRRSIDSGLGGNLNPPTPEIPRVNLTNSRDSGINMESLD